MQYAWGGNVGMQMIKEVADNIAGHGGVILNAATAREMGVAEGDWLEIATAAHRVRAKAVPRQGIRPDTLLLLGQFGHWETPVAKDFGMPSMNSLVPVITSYSIHYTKLYEHAEFFRDRRLPVPELPE